MSTWEVGGWLKSYVTKQLERYRLQGETSTLINIKDILPSSSGEESAFLTLSVGDEEGPAVGDP